jgi:hypothetical protein
MKREVELAPPRLAAGAGILQGLWLGLARKVGRVATCRHWSTGRFTRLPWKDALAGCVRTVQMNHALGITNLVRLFDPELVVIGWSSAALPEAYRAWLH